MTQLRQIRRLFPALAVLVSVCLPASAQDGLTIQGTITGNQEQPKVLYIVPWKTAGDNETFEQTLSSQLLGSVFEHVERAELRREVLYLEKLAEEQATSTE